MKITLLTGKTFDIQEELGFDIKVVNSISSSKLSLHIDSKEHIPVLSVPKFCSRRRAVEFVNENMGWIMTNMAKLPKPKEFTAGDKISLFGQELIIKHLPQERGRVWKQNGCLCVSGGEEFLHRRIKDYIKEQAGKEFYEYTYRYAKIMGCKLTGVSIKDTKSRWGSCSSNKHINYSWRIALAPDYVIQYLMAHEAAHLRHQDHSAEFWKCVEELYAGWKQGHDWLKKYGKNLYAYK